MRWMRAMLVFIPVSIALHLLHGPPVLIFTGACLAIIPLAGIIGKATEELARHHGQAIGGLLNATFGNATELIIGLVALNNGQTAVVKSSLIGSIVGNVLLVLGLSVFLGGMKYKIQSFNREMGGMHAAMLAMAAISLVVPALFVRNSAGFSESAVNPRVQFLSAGVAATLLVLYVGSLLFSLRTHESLFRTPDEESSPPTWPRRKALMVLAASTVAIALESEILVHHLEQVVRSLGINTLFIGMIIVPIVGNAAEHFTAVTSALDNKMDISLNIAFSSSTQIAMFVAPVCIFASMLMGHPMSILFKNVELVAVAVSVAIAALITLDGKSHWLEGAQLLAAYVIIALACFFVP